MRTFLVAAALCLSTSAYADPTCVVNERAGSAVTTRALPGGAVKSSVPFGATVEIVVIGLEGGTHPWALIREPGELDFTHGWAPRRTLTCR